jgi:hypothetical protein
MIDLSKLLDNPLANKISSITDFTNFASTALNTYLIKPDENKGISNGISGWLFDVIEDEMVELNSDITDHYIENNTPMQDHIALKPEIITISGFVGELKNTPPEALKTISSQVDKLQSLSPFAPAITTQAKMIYNQVERGYKIYEKANKTATNIYNSYNKIAKSIELTAQQKAFNFFYLAWQQKQLFTVQTPYQIFETMAILNLRAKQGDNRQISNFEITFKKVRFAQNITTKPKVMDSRTTKQKSEVKDKGVQKPIETGFLKSAWNKLFN